MRLFPFAAALGLAALPAFGETTFSAGGTLELYHDPAGSGSADEIDATIHAEVETQGIYLGASALKSNDEALDEFALGLGYRGEVSGFGYDIGLTRYAYPHDSAANYSELLLGLSKDFDDRFSGGIDFGYDVTNRAASVALGGAYAATDRLELSANVKAYEVPGASNEAEWDLGASYAVTDEVAADLRWYDGSDYADGYVGLVFSWDTSLTR